MSNKVLVIDNGGAYVRAGFNTAVKPQVKLHNCIIQSKKHVNNTTVGDERSFAAFNASGYIVHRPVKAGILVEIDQQIEIWKSVLEKMGLRDEVLTDIGLALTEVYGTPPTVHQELEECCFEQFKFKSALFLQSEVMPHYAFPRSLANVKLIPSPTLLSQDLIDMGFRTFNFNWGPLQGRQAQQVSYTLHTTQIDSISLPPTRMCCNFGYSAISSFPMVHETLVDYAIYKNYTGGRFLDSQFKRAICLRQGRFDFHDLAISRLREKACVLSTDIKRDLGRAKGELRQLARLRSLPDLHQESDTFSSLYIEDTAQLLGLSGKLSSALPAEIVLSTERYGIYESLFNPGTALFDPPWSANHLESKISPVADGWRPRPVYSSHTELRPVHPPKGVPSLFVQSVQSCPPVVQSDMSQSFIFGGGLVHVPGVIERSLKELRQNLPSRWPITVMTLSEAPDISTWLGTTAWTLEHYATTAVTREEYFEGKSDRKARL